MLLGAVFLGAGATLAALRKRAAHANECDDFPECDQPSGLAKSCCSSTASLTGVLEAAEAAEAAASEEEITCKFCDATASCRFCFAGPERGELIAPCACVGSQELVHTLCLRQWQKVSMRTRGVRETNCRVCNASFDVRSDEKPLRKRAALWFSLKARDRLDAYTRAWWQSLVHVFAAERREAALTGARPTVKRALARSGSAKELLVVLASAEAVVWAGRELKRGGESGRLSGEARFVRALAMFGSVVSVVNKLKAFSGGNIAGAVKA